MSLESPPLIMKMILTIEDAPVHKLTHIIGLVVGMGIPYSLEENSELYKIMREKKKELLLGGFNNPRKG